MLNIRKGFTAVEFALGLAIVGMLGAVASEQVVTVKRSAEMVAMKAELHRLVIAEEAYFAENAKYTANLSSLEFRSSNGISAPKITASRSGWSAMIVGGGEVTPPRCGVGINDENPIAPSTVDGQSVCHE